jgi:hypothetical protein
MNVPIDGRSRYVNGFCFFHATSVQHGFADATLLPVTHSIRQGFPRLGNYGPPLNGWHDASCTRREVGSLPPNGIVTRSGGGLWQLVGSVNGGAEVRTRHRSAPSSASAQANRAVASGRDGGANRAGEHLYLWRAVDDEGEVLDVLVQRLGAARGEASAALKESAEVRTRWAEDKPGSPPWQGPRRRSRGL